MTAPDSTLEDLGRRIAAHLQAAAEHPDRYDDPDGIAEQLLALLPTGDGWDASLQAIAETVAASMGSDAQTWPLAVNLARRYYQSAWSTAPHPRASGITAQRDGTKQHSVTLELDRHFLLALMRRATSEQRAAFFSSIPEVSVFHEILEVLPEVDLGSISEGVALVAAVERFRPQAVDHALQEWAERHTDLVRRLVDHWISTTPAPFSAASLAAIVTGVVRHDGDYGWRDRALAALDRSNAPDSSEWALYVACFAWSSQDMVDIATRHDALLARMARSPEQLRPQAMSILGTEARMHPVEALRTALAVTPSEGEELDAARLLAVCAVAARAPRSAELVAALSDALPRLRSVAAGRVRQLDDVLRAMFDGVPALVVQFLGEWLVAHRRELERLLHPLDHIFPLLCRCAGDAAVCRWLVQFLTSFDEDLRLLAVELSLRRDDHRLVDGSFSSLSATQAQATVHTLAGAGMGLPDGWTRPVFQVAVECPDARQLAIRVILEDGVIELPGGCEEALPSWHTVPELGAASATVEEALKARRTAVEANRDVPELRCMIPAHMEWSYLQNQLAQRAHREAEQASPLMKLVTHIHVVCGDEASFGPSPPTPFQEFNVTYELPQRHAVDPLATRDAVARHLARARELLAQATASQSGVEPTS